MPLFHSSNSALANRRLTARLEAPVKRPLYGFLLLSQLWQYAHAVRRCTLTSSTASVLDEFLTVFRTTSAR